MEIEYKEIEQDWANETTRYWFIVDGEEYCLADQNGDLTLLDCDGCPIHSEESHIAQGNALDRKIFNALVRRLNKMMRKINPNIKPIQYWSSH